MVYSSLFIFSISANIIAGLLALFMFIMSFRRKSHFCKCVLKNWSFAFFLITFLKIPTILAASGKTIVISGFLQSYYVISFILSVVAFLLFYRGAALMITRRNFWINICPIIIFIIFALLISALEFLIKASIANIVSVVFSLHYAAILFMIIVVSKSLWEKASHAMVKIGITSIIIGWILYLISNTYVWISISNYPEEFWFFATMAHSYVYLLFSIGHAMVMAGLLLCCIGKRRSLEKDA